MTALNDKIHNECNRPCLVNPYANKTFELIKLCQGLTELHRCLGAVVRLKVEEELNLSFEGGKADGAAEVGRSFVVLMVGRTALE